jgi:hypothetical protein
MKPMGGCATSPTPLPPLMQSPALGPSLLSHSPLSRDSAFSLSNPRLTLVHPPPGPIQRSPASSNGDGALRCPPSIRRPSSPQKPNSRPADALRARSSGILIAFTLSCFQRRLNSFGVSEAFRRREPLRMHSRKNRTDRGVNAYQPCHHREVDSVVPGVSGVSHWVRSQAARPKSGAQ